MEDNDTQTPADTMPRPSGHGQKDDMFIVGEGPARDKPTSFMFSRMFPPNGTPPINLKLSSCAIIGNRMTTKSEADRGDSKLPAGYTYFGQFVDHDVSLDTTESGKTAKGPGIGVGEGDDPSTPVIEATADMDLVQMRSPSLDLDSLYGATQMADPELMNGAKFILGKTSRSPGIPVSGEELSNYDLPRHLEPKEGKQARPAKIGDGRNDENLAVAQIHLMWLKFHNAVVDRVNATEPMLPTDKLLEKSRRLTTLHYQWVVLHDFVKRYIDADVFQRIVVEGKRKELTQSHGEVAAMPLEFSVAAYRHGHSQVREVYDWNANFGDGGPLARDGGERLASEAPFEQLFEFSEVSGNFFGLPTLPTNWLPDMRRLFDLTGADLPNLEKGFKGDLNMAKKIDPFIASALGDIPELREMVRLGIRPFSNLASLNLRRGSMRNLPSGQEVSKRLPDAKMLTKSEMRSVIDEPFDTVMTSLGLYERTPLWLYVLLEASVRHDGDRMGDVGSIVTAETFMNLIVTSRTSILQPGQEWTPDESVHDMESDGPLDSIPAILLWLDKKEPIIDPLQDDRLTGTS